MGSSRKIASGVAWSTVVTVVNAVYGFIAVPILIAHFGKAEYGLIGLAISVNVYMNLMDMGFNSTNVRFYSTWLANKNFARLQQGFQTSLSFYGVIGLLNALVLLIVAHFSSSLFNVTPAQDATLKHLFYILAISAFCQWFSSCFDQIIRATENVAWIQKRTLVTKLLMIGVLAATVALDLSIEAYYVLICLAALSIVPMFVGKIRRETPFVSFVPRWHASAFREMLPYSLNIFSFSLFQFSFYQLRPVFLGMQGNLESVTDYHVLDGIIKVVTLLGGAFVSILLPSTSKVVATHNSEAYYRVAYDGTKYISILICFCCFGMMTVGPEVLTLYVGESYLYLIPWLNLWLLCTLGTHNQAISSLILAGSDIRAISYSSAFASIAGLILAWLLIPYYQIGGVCIAFAVYVMIQLLFYYCYYWPRRMQINPWKVLRSFMLCVAVGVLATLIVTNGLSQIASFSSHWLRLAYQGLLFALIYIVLIRAVVINKTDKAFIKSIVRRNA